MLYNKDYSINIINNGVYIVNYVKVIDISLDKCVIYVKEKSVIIEGSNFRLSKLNDIELFIKGNVERVKLNDIS